MAKYLLKNGWGKDSARASRGIQYPLTNQRVTSAASAVMLFLALRPVFLADCTSDPSGIRKGMHLFVVTEEAARAWDWTVDPTSANATTTLSTRNIINCVVQVA